MLDVSYLRCGDIYARFGEPNICHGIKKRGSHLGDKFVPIGLKFFKQYT